MIHIRANRAYKGFVELHIKPDFASNGESVDFPGCTYVTVKDLDDLVTTLQEVQHFMANEPEPNYRKWEIS